MSTNTVFSKEQQIRADLEATITLKLSANEVYSCQCSASESLFWGVRKAAGSPMKFAAVLRTEIKRRHQAMSATASEFLN